MPRDPPVTRAVLPSSEQNSATRGGEGLLELVDLRRSVYGDRLDAPVDPPDEPGEDVARADLDERAYALLHELLRRLGEPHRRGQLLDEERPHPLRLLDPRGHRRHEGRRRLVELHP